MLRTKTTLLALAVFLATASGARAQSSSADREVVSAAELRTGTIAGFERDGGPPSIGGAIELRPWTSMGQRLSIYLHSDIRRLGRYEVFDVPLNSRTRLSRSVFLLGAALGVDVVRTPRTSIGVRAGASFVRDHVNFEIDSADGFVNDDNEFEPVCAFTGFSDRCPTDYVVTPTIAVGFRQVVKRNGSFYVGADYMRLFRGQNVIVAVLGVR